jgi:serine/threonine protein kinase
MAPETQAGRSYDPRKVDIWTLGVCLFVLLFGIYPYKKASTELCAYFREIAGGRLVTLVTGWGMAAGVSPESLDLVARILHVDPAHRPTIDDILAHPWFALPLGQHPGGGSGGAAGNGGGPPVADGPVPGGGGTDGVPAAGTDDVVM